MTNKDTEQTKSLEFMVISASYFGTFKSKSEGIAWMVADFLNDEYKTDTFKVYDSMGNLLNRPMLVKNKSNKKQAPDICKQKFGMPLTDDEPIKDTSEGKKYDGNKPMTGTVLRVFPQAMNAVGACIKFGTKKYPDPNNWKKNLNALVRYNDSLIRHLTKFFAGKELDEETNLPHLAHVAWNALAILELYLMERPNEANKIMFPEEIRD